MSKGGERIDETLVVHLPQIETIHVMETFKEDAPPNGMWICCRCNMSIFMPISRTRCIRLEEMQMGTRPVQVSWLSIAASCQGGIVKNVTWNHMYVEDMELT